VRIERGVAIAGMLLISGCVTLAPPTVPPIATSVHAAFEGRIVTFTVTPWPRHDGVAFRCLGDAGPS
jgi:hypothetical protein